MCFKGLKYGFNLYAISTTACWELPVLHSNQLKHKAFPVTWVVPANNLLPEPEEDSLFASCENYKMFVFVNTNILGYLWWNQCSDKQHKSGRNAQIICFIEVLPGKCV